LTFDDGPYRFTGQILDTLRSNNIRATFFVNGANWDNILSENSRALVQRMVRENHQVGSHTWSHADLTTLDRDGIVNQMDLLESALQQILGYFPTYMRPPYFSYNDLVLQTMAELGYHVINADIDTLDWANQSEQGIQTSVQRFRDGLNAGGSISLAHDVHQWTAQILTQAMIDEVKRRGLRAVTVGECLGDPKELWYRTG
jgi:peptidoglycan/xylan/chitin deacetylase (PgdA/CDA1 family)